MFYCCTKLHGSKSNGYLVITTKLTAKKNVHATAILFYILSNDTLKKPRILAEHITLHQFRIYKEKALFASFLEISHIRHVIISDHTKSERAGCSVCPPVA